VSSEFAVVYSVTAEAKCKDAELTWAQASDLQAQAYRIYEWKAAAVLLTDG